jgi:cyclophilin family peptidyl-prolyl cis-trans isomerase
MKLTVSLLTLALAASVALAEAPAPEAKKTTNPRVTLETTKGKIVIELDAAKAPKTVENFIAYVESGFYNGTIFHRVIPKFMIQGGGFTSEMEQNNTRAPIMNEADNGLKNLRGTIAMARTSDPHSASSQFFINTVENGSLNHRAKIDASWGYCVFGQVVDGMGVVDEISKTPTGVKSGMRDVPNEPIAILKATVQK